MNPKRHLGRFRQPLSESEAFLERGVITPRPRPNAWKAKAYLARTGFWLNLIMAEIAGIERQTEAWGYAEIVSVAPLLWPPERLGSAAPERPSFHHALKTIGFQSPPSRSGSLTLARHMIAIDQGSYREEYRPPSKPYLNRRARRIKLQRPAYQPIDLERMIVGALHQATNREVSQ